MIVVQRRARVGVKAILERRSQLKCDAVAAVECGPHGPPKLEGSGTESGSATMALSAVATVDDPTLLTLTGKTARSD